MTKENEQKNIGGGVHVNNYSNGQAAQMNKVVKSTNRFVMLGVICLGIFVFLNVWLMRLNSQ